MPLKLSKTVKTTLRLSLCRTSGSHNGWVFRVVDAPSSLILAEADLSHEQFGEMFNAEVEVPGEVWSTDRAGMTLEVKRVYVAMSHDELHSTGAMALATKRALDQLDKSWRIDAEGKTYNPHRYQKGKYEMTARRWLPK